MLSRSCSVDIPHGRHKSIVTSNDEPIGPNKRKVQPRHGPNASSFFFPQINLYLVKAFERNDVIYLYTKGRNRKPPKDKRKQVYLSGRLRM